MSYTKAVTIWCDGIEDDGSGCVEWHDGMGGGAIGDTPTVKAARDGGRAAGWVYRNGRDLCPYHSGGEQG
jgi:hypothetical protein